MTMGAAERRRVNADLVASFLRREIDWKTLLAVREPEPYEPPEPLDPEQVLDEVRLCLVKADHQIAMLRNVVADTDELRKEIERLWREQPAQEKTLKSLLARVCAARQCAVEHLPLWESLREKYVALGVKVEEQKGADGAGSNESA